MKIKMKIKNINASDKFQCSSETKIIPNNLFLDKSYPPFSPKQSITEELIQVQKEKSEQNAKGKIYSWSNRREYGPLYHFYHP